MKMNCMGLLAISVSVFVIYVSSISGGVYSKRNEPYCFTSKDRCRNYAKKDGWYKVGGCNGYAFSGNYGTKGCYVYSRNAGVYKNCVFFGTGGDKDEMNSEVEDYAGYRRFRLPLGCNI